MAVGIDTDNNQLKVAAEAAAAEILVEMATTAMTVMVTVTAMMTTKT